MTLAKNDKDIFSVGKAAKIKKDASIARAQAERDVAIAQAEANKASNDARVLAESLLYGVAIRIRLFINLSLQSLLLDGAADGGRDCKTVVFH